MKQTTLILLILSLFFGLFSCKHKDASFEAKASEAPKFRSDGMLKILSAEGDLKASFEIEVASTDAQHFQGLKHRESMQDDQGMLFVFDGNQPHGFWMQDTYMSLDMLFIDYTNTIFQINERTTPFSEELIEAEGFNLYTLEIKAGMCAKNNIKIGDKIQWERTALPSLD